jgi:hypothetical protein
MSLNDIASIFKRRRAAAPWRPPRHGGDGRSVLKSGAYKGLVGCSDAVPVGYNNTDVTATLSNNSGVLLVGKYKCGPVTASGGYEWLKLANPSDDYLNGFETIGGWNVPATNIERGKVVGTAWTNYTNYTVNRIAPYFFFSAPNMRSLPRST